MAKKGKCPEFENHERWLVSYADMLTLLFAVFVVLFALKEGGEPQIQRAAGSMQESFNTPLEDIPIDRKLGPSEQGFGIFEHFKGSDTRPPMVEKYPQVKDTIRAIDDEMNRVKLEITERLYGPKNQRDSDVKGNSRIVNVERTKTGFKLQLFANHFYEEGALDIKPSSLPEFQKVMEVVQKLGRDVTIEGHTDTQTPKKGQMNSWDISALRATHLVRLMTQKMNFPETRLSAAGYGDQRPIAHNGSASGRALNRRIEIQINYNQNGH